jgi:hypothetical protein
MGIGSKRDDHLGPSQVYTMLLSKTRTRLLSSSADSGGDLEIFSELGQTRSKVRLIGLGACS